MVLMLDSLGHLHNLTYLNGFFLGVLTSFFWVKESMGAKRLTGAAGSVLLRQDRHGRNGRNGTATTSDGARGQWGTAKGAVGP